MRQSSFSHKTDYSPQTFGHDAQVAAMFECAFQAHDMLFILEVGVVQFSQYLCFFSPRYVPERTSEKLEPVTSLPCSPAIE